MKVVWTKVRKCGKRVLMGTYLVSEVSKTGGTLPVWTTLHSSPPVESFFRGVMSIDGDALVAGKPQYLWGISKSLTTEERFGMTFKRRKEFGECLGAGDEAMAYAFLLGSVAIDPTNLRVSLLDIIQKKIGGEGFLASVSTKVAQLLEEPTNQLAVEILADFWRVRSSLRKAEAVHASYVIRSLGFYLDAYDYPTREP